MGRSGGPLGLGAVLVALAASGFAGLVYEICWIRRASLAFGSTTAAVSTIVGVFFLGLAAGSHAFGRFASRVSRPLRLYALLEVALAVLAAASLPAFSIAEAAYGAVYRAIPHGGGMLVGARAILIALVVFPPAVLMGGTLPVLSRWLVREGSTASRQVGVLYAVNTLGAALGAIAAGFLLLPALGLRASVLTGAGVSLAAGLIVLLLPESKEALAAPASVARSRRPETASSPALATLYFVVGFVALGAEVLWTRYLGLFLHAEVHTYALTLGVVLAGIVIGSIVASRWLDRPAAGGRVLGALLVAVGLSILALTILPASWWRERSGEPWSVFLGMLVPSILSGAAFPVVVRLRVATPADAAPGTGTLLAVNTVGGLVGSLVAGFYLLPVLGLDLGLRVITGVSVGGGLVAWFVLDRGLPQAARAGLVAASVAAWAAIPLASRAHLPEAFLGEHGPLVAFREGLGSNLAVIRNDGALELEIDRWWQGGDARSHQLVVAHLPMLLHEQARRVLVVGVGTGQTASRFLDYPVTRLDCVDVEPALFEFVREHFPAAWMDDPRTRLILEDGRSVIAHSAERYDVVSLEIGQIFRPGAAYFYTRDFYEQVRSRLAPDGLVTQFVPVPFFTPDQFRNALASFVSVFPRSLLWYNTSELILIGCMDELPRLDPMALTARLRANPAVAEDLELSYWGGPADWIRDPFVLLAGFLAGPEGLGRLAAGAHILRDDRPVLDYAAAGAWRRPTHEAEIVTLLQRHLDPVGRILAPSGASAEADLAKTRALRDLNLRDIVASAIVRGVEDARGREPPSQAAERLERALEWNPESVNAHRMLADMRLLEGRLDLAEAEFRRAVAIDSANARAQAGLAHVLHRTRRIEEALAHYERAANGRPWDAQLRNNLGAALAETGRFEDARHRFEEALRIDPGNADVRLNLSRLPAR